MGEFALIDTFVRALPHAKSPRGPGDDAAVLEVAGRLCVTTDATFGVSFRTGVTQTCTTRDIRMLPALTVGQNVRATATAPTYAVTLELRNAANNAVLQRVVAPTTGGTATLNYTNGLSTPLVYIRVFGGTTVNEYVNLVIQP